MGWALAPVAPAPVRHLPARSSFALAAAPGTIAARRGTGQGLNGIEHQKSWKHEILDLRERVGELAFVLNFYGACGQRVVMGAAKVPEGAGDPVLLTDADTATTGDTLSAVDHQAMATAAGIRDDALGQGVLLRRLMEAIAGIGDAWIMATETRLPGAPGEAGVMLSRTFEVLTIAELYPDTTRAGATGLTEDFDYRSGEGMVRKRTPETPAKPLPKLDAEGHAITYTIERIWDADLRYSGQSTSPMRACRQTLRLIETCDALTEALMLSRLAMRGILLWPAEAQPAGADLPDEWQDPADAGMDPGYGLDPAVDVDGVAGLTDPATGRSAWAPVYPGATEDEKRTFVDDLLDQGNRNLENPRDAAAMLPLAVEIAADLIDKPKFLEWSAKLEDFLLRLREMLVLRLAQQVDLPPSVVTGQTGNRWSDFTIKESMFQTALAPKLSLITGMLTSRIYRAMLAADLVANGLMGSPDAAYAAAQGYCLWFDASALVERIDKSDHADQAIDRMAIGYSPYLRAKGFDTADQPTPDELTKMVVLSMIKADPSYATVLAPLLGIVIPDLPAKPMPPQFGGPPADANPPATGGGGDSPPTEVTPVTNPDKAAGTVAAAVAAATHRAGAQILTQARGAKSSPAERQLLAETPPLQRYRVIGPERVHALGLSPRALLGDMPGLVTLDLPGPERARVCAAAVRLAEESLVSGRLPEVDAAWVTAQCGAA